MKSTKLLNIKNLLVVSYLNVRDKARKSFLDQNRTSLFLNYEEVLKDF